MAAVTDLEKQFADELDVALKGFDTPSGLAINLAMTTNSKLEYLTEFALLNYNRAKEGSQTRSALSDVLTKHNPEAFARSLHVVCEKQYHEISKLEKEVAEKESRLLGPTEYITLLRENIRKLRDRNCELVVCCTRLLDSVPKKIEFTLAELKDNALVIEQYTGMSTTLDEMEASAVWHAAQDAEARRRTRGSSTEDDSDSPVLSNPKPPKMARQNAMSLPFPA